MVRHGLHGLHFNETNTLRNLVFLLLSYVSKLRLHKSLILSQTPELTFIAFRDRSPSDNASLVKPSSNMQFQSINETIDTWIDKSSGVHGWEVPVERFNHFVFVSCPNVQQI